jgi:glycosyltransferase involved in cell wall biosynthesis
MRPVLVGACYGDPFDPHALSGVAFHLLEALAARYELPARIDYRLTGTALAVAAARSFSFSRERWRERFQVSPASLKLISRKIRAELQSVTAAFDLVVQVLGGVVEPHGWPYVLYKDTTWRSVEVGWPQWLPSRRDERRFWYEAEERIYREARHVFTMGQAEADSLIESYGVPAGRVTVVGGGLNATRLPRLDDCNREREAPTILFVGRDYLRKGCDVLIDAFRDLRKTFPTARLRIAGLEDVPREPGVEVVGVVADRERMHALFAEATAFCLPSRFEPYGLVLVEAMAHALPCVATGVGGIPEIVRDGETGLLVPVGDSWRLAAALAEILGDPVRAAAMGRAGRRRVETELTWERVVDRMAPALEGAATSRG